MKQLTKLTDADIKRLGVQAMSNTPARRSSYGESQLTPQQIKERIDRLPAYIGGLLNAVIDAIGGDEFGEYTRLNIGGKMMTLSEIASKLSDGEFSYNINVRVDKDINTLAYWISRLVEESTKQAEDIKKIGTDKTSGAFARALAVTYDGEGVSLQAAVDDIELRLDQSEALPAALDAVLDEILAEQEAIINIIEEGAES